MVLVEGDAVQGLLGEYLIEGVVGEGGFGVTYRASTTDGNVVALKQIRLAKADSWKALELFEREAAVLQTLSHPKIPSYVEFFATTPSGPVLHEPDSDASPGSFVLVQTLIEGADLERRMARGERLEFDRVWEVVSDVLEVLDYLHGLSPPVVHRDVNPRNIVVSDDGETFLVDFGAIQQSLSLATIGGSTAVGTLGYIPIEQSLGKARPSSDLYALAVTTLVLMSGLQPEELPLDEATSKIDFTSMGLDFESTEQRRRLASFLSVALEPLVAGRLESAKVGQGILEGNDAIAVRREDLPDVANTPSWKRTLFLLSLGGSLGGAGIIYPLNFDNFSEDQLVGMAPFWVLPAAFGALGLMLQHTENPIRNAFIGSVLAAGALVVFLFGIFPSL